MLGRHLGKGDATRVAQMFCPYKEVLADYEAGLKVPDDVTIVWPDDNFGYIRRFATSRRTQAFRRARRLLSRSPISARRCPGCGSTPCRPL